MLHTTQQTVARWESGKVTPSVSALRDLATLFSTSVDDLLGENPFSEKMVTNTYYILRGDADGFWGHLGILHPGEPKTIWYPVTIGERRRLWRHLRSAGDSEWFVTTTLNNRILAFRAELMKRVWLLDDACDEPDGDWEWKTLWDDYNGLPKEVYRAMSEWAWDQLTGGNDFVENNSDTLQEIALETIKEGALLEKPEDVVKAIHHTSVRLRTGETFTYEVDPDELWSAIQELEAGLSQMLYLPKVGGDFDTFFSSSEVVSLDMPLIDVERSAKAAVEELEQA
jgi:transcriptional regulator with XRE-family HTH domain